MTGNTALTDKPVSLAAGWLIRGGTHRSILCDPMTSLDYNRLAFPNSDAPLISHLVIPCSAQPVIGLGLEAA